MRRPLCLLGLAFVMVLLLGIHLIPHDSPDYGGLAGETLAAVGRVEWKEHRISGSDGSSCGHFGASHHFEIGSNIRSETNLSRF